MRKGQLVRSGSCCGELLHPWLMVHRKHRSALRTRRVLWRRRATSL
jgi:hypothetical protein